MNDNNAAMTPETICKKQFWNNTINNITLGFMMSALTLNFWGLQYILPSIGAVLLYIGFRNLKQENKFLYSTWIFSIVNMIINVTNLIYLTTPLNVKFEYTLVKTLILTAFKLIFLIAFREGIKNIFHNNNKKLNRDPILMLIIWNILVVICATTLLGQIWYISILIIIFYFYVFQSLYKLKYDLENIDCTISAHNIRLSNKKLFISYIIGCIFIVSISCITSNHIKLDSTEFIPSESSTTRDTLINKGFPKDIINYIDDEAISLLQDALYIESFSQDLNFNSISKNKLKCTTIFIEVPNYKIYAIEFFNWENGKSYWNDGFAISATEDIELINGKLLYEHQGIQYTASIPRLNHEIVTSNDMFGNVDQSDTITGAISYPFGSINQKGYIFYNINFKENTILGGNIINYLHYNTPFRIPYIMPEYQNLMFNDHLEKHYTNFTTQKNREITD